MTIPVEIKHTMPTYDKAITVRECSVDSTGQPIYREPQYDTVVQPGKSTIKYVWPGQMLVVVEGPASTAPTENDTRPSDVN